MNAMQINNGPFKGESFSESETFHSYMEDGTIRASVQMAKLTARFLEKFCPVKGWSVSVAGEFVPLDMVPLARHNNPGAPATHVPAAKFVATLTSPEGKVIGTASSLWTIQGPTDWEKGETNARQRLYEAMGLQTRFGETQGASQEPRPRSQLASVSKLHTPTEKPVKVTPIDEEPVKQEAEKPKMETVQEQAPKAEPTQVEPEAEKQPKVEKEAKPATKTAPATSEQSAMDLGEEDPLQQPPPAAMVQQIERLAKLMQKTLPELKTKQEALDFLGELQGRGS